MGRIKKYHTTGENYKGEITAHELPNGTYKVNLNRSSFIVADLSNPVEVDSPYYKAAISNKHSESDVTIVPYVAPEEQEVELSYAIWDYVEDHKKRASNKSPKSIRYSGAPHMAINPHKEDWIDEGYGLVMQTIYYAEYDEATSTPSVPLVRERWSWVVEPGSNFVKKRSKDIQWYAKQLDEDGNPQLIDKPIKVTNKHYRNARKQIAEIQRRRENVVALIEENVITFILVTHVAANPMDITAEEKSQAIALGQEFLDHISEEVHQFIKNGTVKMVDKIIDIEVPSGDHPWLANDLAILGKPGVNIAEYIIHMITFDIYDVITNFDHSILPEY